MAELQRDSLKIVQTCQRNGAEVDVVQAIRRKWPDMED